MTRCLLATIVLLLTSTALAQNPGQQKKATAEYRDGVRAYAAMQAEEDADEKRALARKAAGHFETAYRLLIVDVHQSQLMRGLALAEQGSMDEAAAVFGALTDSPSEAVRERARSEYEAVMQGLGEAEWARLEFECGAAEVSVWLEPRDVVGENVVIAAQLGKWVPCSAWSKASVVRPGLYALRLRRDREGEDQPEYVIQRQLDLGIGARKEVSVHFELAPSPPISFSPCGGCGSGPECRPVRIGGEPVEIGGDAP